MAVLVDRIRMCIEEKLDRGLKRFIIFPFGDIGLQVKNILNNLYGIQEEYILDNNLYKYNTQIKEISFLNKINCKEYCLILSCVNPDIYEELKSSIQIYFNNENIAEFFDIPDNFLKEKKGGGNTKIGKYSYGPLCRNHLYIESIGAFCSFASGTKVVQNHEMNYLTTHPMIYAGTYFEGNYKEYTDYKDKDWYFEGVIPKGDKTEKRGKSRIGNDVWLGENVIITNYANIGNGVIAGAGSIITRDVPDYAIVVGVPAKVISYRYSQEEIESLNKIAWWGWTDDEIRERYEDFYLPVQDFIKKYLK